MIASLIELNVCIEFKIELRVKCLHERYLRLTCSDKALGMKKYRKMMHPEEDLEPLQYPRWSAL